jgi:hypothetical protein
MSAIMNFESTVYVNEQLNRLMVNTAQDLAQRSIKAAAEHYNFDAEEALRLLGLENVKVARTRPIEVKSKKEKVVITRPAFPMPYNGEFNDACCYALRQNSGLYTQCQAIRKSKTTDGKGDAHFCKQCQVLADKNEGTPEYGTIQMRQATGIFEYTDPKGRKPVAYTKVMKKYKIDQEKVLDEAGKFNININDEHFVVAEVDSKRGRPKAEKVPKEAKGSKGRPKKAKKVLQIEGDDDDLFASLVADANNNSGDEAVITPKGSPNSLKKKGKSEEEKEAERLAKEAEKEAKKAALELAKAEKEAKLAEEKKQKELKLAEEKAARDLKKAKEEEEKLAKKAALELAKKEKEEKLAAEKALAEQKKEAAKANKSKKPAAAAKEPEVEEEPDVVKKIEFEGKKYLKSKKTGIVYDYQEYVKNGEQVMVGKWNDSKNKIDFNKAADEEEEEEYDM